MAKGQQRGNREAKKPKKDKPKAAPETAGAAWSTLDKMQPKIGGGKKK